MEKAQLKTQYGYRQNANLVLTSENRSKDLGPSSEVLSLGSKLKLSDMVKKFGDRVEHAKPAELTARLEKAKKKRERKDKDESDRPRTRQRVKRDDDSVLSADVDGVYRPQTRETKQAYEVLLAFLQTEGGFQSHEVLRSLADEVLAVLKNDKMTQPNKKKEVEGLFRKSLTDEQFSRLVNIGSKITDYKTEQEAAAEAKEAKSGEQKDLLDEDAIGVPVIFDKEQEEDEEEKDDLDEVREEKDLEADDEEGLKEADTGAVLEAKHDDDASMEDVGQHKDDVDARTIDAFWLQRELGKFYKDALMAQQYSEDVLQLLSSAEADPPVENKLVGKLEFDKFAFVKILMRNRSKIVYCTKLARAKDEKEKQTIRDEMSADPKLKTILDALQKTSTAAERNMMLEQKLINEARGLKGRDSKQGDTSVGSDAKIKAGDAFWHKKPKAMLDLENLSFDKGAHLMSNAECKLPPKSQQITKKGYRTVFVPASQAKMPEGEKLVPIASLPEWSRVPFQKMTSLNRIQSRVFETAMLSAENMLICAPTGAGKTNIAMLTMLREIGLHRKQDGSINLDAFKIIYVAPMKSLVQEMVLNFSERLKGYGISVKELSGDAQLSRQQIEETQVIVTTPEKFDVISRKAGDRSYTNLVKLIIIDEIHLLHDTRGPVLESIVARMIRQIEQTQELIRLVGLSATLPNYEDVALFLRVKPDKGLFFFDSAYRPVALQQQYIGITEKKAFKRHQMMNELTFEKVCDQVNIPKGEPYQTLVFVHSRKDTIATARYLRDQAMEKGIVGKFVRSEGSKKILEDELKNVKSEALKDLLPYGFAVHHAGMVRSDRTLVEDLFADRHISVLVSTATLAWGVNLPARTIIIKGTEVYSPEKGKWVQLSPMDVLQMCGRAGRPQFDKEGEAIVITDHRQMQYYLSLLNEQLPVESQMVSKLPDILNAEIVLGTISNVKDAVNWLGYTYLYVRMLRRPQLYGIGVDEVDQDPLLEQRRIDLVHTAASLLDKNALIKYDRKTGAFQVTDLGRIASYYYLSFTSMAVYNEYLKPQISDIELLRVFSLSAEFKHMSVREEEKLELAKMLDKVPIPVKESIEEPTAKVNVLLQTYISRLKLDGFALMADMTYITQSAGRLMRALYEIVLKRGWAAAANKCLALSKMVSHRMWGAQSPLRQFRGIPPEIITRLEGKDFPWERLFDLEPAAIGELVRFPKLGPVIHRAVHQLPKLEMKAHVQPITRTVLRVELTLTPDFQFDEKVHGTTENFWVQVEDVDGETILHYEFFTLKRKFAQESHTLSFTIPISEPMPPQYYVRVVSDKWIGSESVLAISFRHLLLPERYPAPTELLDLRPAEVKDLANEKYMQFYEKQFDRFNPIQTQVFNTIYKKDVNVLVCAPTGSGKTVLAELAIMRMLSTQTKENPGRCVYIAPIEALAKERFDDWKIRFGAIGVSVARLTGDTNTDLVILDKTQIAISTPEVFDQLSRRWKTRKQVKAISLFIVDELHLIGQEVGPILEVIVARVRYMVHELNKPIRMLGLSTSVANARDLGEWMGAQSNCIFNFPPNVRPVRLEIRVQGFDQSTFTFRQQAMLKPTYQACRELARDKPVIIFVPSRKQARQVAVELVAMSNSEEEPNQFLHADIKDIEPHLKNIKNKVLDTVLRSGVGFYHNGLSERERNTVEILYNSGACQVLVVEQKCCWGMRKMFAHLVVIMGTQYYDGSQHRYVDCPISDVLQMMGRASRPPASQCCIFCVSSKKEFYKKFLYEPLPVESHLDQAFHDHVCSEIVTKRIENPQDAVDYLTYSFLYRRITQNPNYYNLTGVSHRHISDYLSKLVETTLEDLQSAKMISVEEQDVNALNLGIIASFYYLKYETLEKFADLIKASTKLKGLLAVLASASEFDSITVRHREDLALQKLAHHLPWSMKEPNYTEAHTKVNVLLLAHMSRIELTSAVADDLRKILPDALRLLQAMVDVVSSNFWLVPALACMELSQMLTQAQYNTDSVLLQLPHFDKKMVERCAKEFKVEDINGVTNLEDEDRNKLFAGLTKTQQAEVADFCNRYPDVSLRFELADQKDEKVSAGQQLSLNVELVRDEDDEDSEELTSVPVVAAPRYPVPKLEGWWLVLGNSATNQILSIKKVNLKSSLKLKMPFEAPSDSGDYELKLYLMSDSYLGVDQEHAIPLSVSK